MSNNTESKKIIGNSIWVIASKIINIVVGLFVSVCVTRYLGAEQKGIMADASAISSLFGFIAYFGLIDIIISKFAKEQDKSGAVAGAGMFLMLCGGIAAFLITVAFAFIIGVDKEVFFYVVMCALPLLYNFLCVYEYWFYSRSNSKRYSIAQSVIHIVFLFIRIAGVPLKAPLIFFIGMIVLEESLIKLSTLLCYKMNCDFFAGAISVDMNMVKDMARLALPMLLSGFASAVYLKIDQIMIGRLIGHTELGLYSVAVQLAEYWYFIPSALYNSFLPYLSSCFDDKETYYKRLQKFADIVVGVGYAVAIGVMILGRFVIRLLYGIEFDGSASILMIYIWSGVFTCLALPGTATYVINKDTKTVLAVNVAGAVINFILNIIFISLFGAIGAAVATLVEYMVVAFGQMIILRKKYGELYIVQLRSLMPIGRLIGYAKERL